MLTSLLLNLRAYVSHNRRQSSSTDRMNNSDFWRGKRGKSFRIWQLGNPRTIWNEALGCLLPKSVRKPLRDLAADFKIESQTVHIVRKLGITLTVPWERAHQDDSWQSIQFKVSPCTYCLFWLWSVVGIVLVSPTLLKGPKPLQSESGVHRRFESCVGHSLFFSPICQTCSRKLFDAFKTK